MTFPCGKHHALFVQKTQSLLLASKLCPKKCVKSEQVLYLILKLTSRPFMFLIVCMHVNVTLKGSQAALDFIIFIPFFHLFFHEKVRARPNRALIKREIAMLMHALFLSSGTMRHNGANV